MPTTSIMRHTSTRQLLFCTTRHGSTMQNISASARVPRTLAPLTTVAMWTATLFNCFSRTTGVLDEPSHYTRSDRGSQGVGVLALYSRVVHRVLYKLAAS